MYNKRELNLQPNETTIYMHTYLWRMHMKTLIDHLTEESRYQRKCRHLPEICFSSSYQLGALISKRFSERMASVANLLVDAHRIRLDQYNIDKMIVLRMSKRFIEIF